jgi:hypothetical protein
MISLQQALTDGLICSLVMSVLIIASLYANPRLWLQDYPKAIQAKVPPLNRQEKRWRLLLAVPLIALLMGFPLYSTYNAEVANGGTLPFLSAFLHAFIVSNIFNLWDAIVLDLALLTFMKPKFATIPGAEGMEYLYNDWGMHLTNFLKGVVFCTVFSLIVASVITLL